jgi:hypothetical protein
MAGRAQAVNKKTNVRSIVDMPGMPDLEKACAAMHLGKRKLV